MTWLGHLLRFENRTPAKISLKEALEEQPTKQGRPKSTWLLTIKNDIKDLKLVEVTRNDTIKTMLNKIHIIAQDRQAYRSLLKNCIPRKGCPTWEAVA